MGRDKENLQEWKKKNIFRYEINIHKEIDKDIYECFSKIENKKTLIQVNKRRYI